jgi:hypothetical protein
MDPQKTEYERSDEYNGGEKRHLAHGSFLTLGFPQIGQMGGII